MTYQQELERLGKEFDRKVEVDTAVAIKKLFRVGMLVMAGSLVLAALGTVALVVAMKWLAQ